MQAVMIFIDGIGLGSSNEATNPFIYTPMPGVRKILGNSPLCREAVGRINKHTALLELDACLGVAGIPQSATGQSALFTGENTPQLLGYHLNHYPNEQIKDVLRRRGIFRQILEAGLKPAFLNAYRPEFFADLKNGLTRPHSCSTLITYYAGMVFRNVDDLHKKEAVYMDITNQFLARLGYPIDCIAPALAAQILIKEASKYDFLLFEYFLSDLAGHSGDRETAQAIVAVLDEFLTEVVAGLDHEQHLLVVASDHGNLEEIDHGHHTANPVPGLLIGPSRWLTEAENSIFDLTDVPGFLLNALIDRQQTTKAMTP